MIRHALHGLLNVGILLILLLVGAAILVQTSLGKRFVATTLSSWLSTPDAGIEITDLHGWIPIDMQIGGVRLSDRTGVWLDANDITFHWSPSALFGGRLQIDEIRTKRLHLARLPEESEEVDPPTTEPFRLPELPKSLPPLSLADLAFDTIDLDAPVLGEAASFALDGSLTASDDGRKADLTLDLQRLDQATAFLTLTSTIELDPEKLTIDLDAGETGELLKQLTGHADAGNLDLSLEGKGPLDDWSGQLNASAEGLGTVDAALALALVEEPYLGIDASLRPIEQALPAGLGNLIGAGVDLSLAVKQKQAQAISIEHLDINADQLGLKGSGHVDFDQGDLVLKAALDAPDLGVLSKVADLPLVGELGLTLDVDGTLQEPNGNLAIRGSKLNLDGTDVNDLTTTVDWQAKTPLDAELTGFHVSLTGAAKGLFIPDTPLPDDKVLWRAELDLPLEGAIDVQEATIDMAGATLRTQGTIDPVTLASDIDLQLGTENLKSLVLPYGQPIDGKALINAAIKSNDDAEQVSIIIKAALSQLSNLPDGAKELLGDTLTLDTAIDLDDQRYLKVSDIKLKGEEAALDGGFDLDLENQNVSGDVKVTLPRLAAFASLIDQPIEGALDLDLNVGGNLGAPVADLTLTGAYINIADEPIGVLSLNVQGTDLTTSPKGELTLDLSARNTPLSLALDYHLENNLLNLPKLRLTGPETVLDGGLMIDLDTTLIDGTVAGAINDLAALQPLLEQSLQGSIDLDARLSSDQSRQDAALSVKARDIEGDFGRIENIDLNAAIQDLLGQARISAKTDLEGYQQDTIKLSTLSLQTDGDLERLAIDLDLDGEAIEPLSLEMGAALSLKGPLALDIDHIDGLFAGEKLHLKGPLKLEQGDETLRLANLDLRLGNASLKGNVDIGQSMIDGRIDLRSLPLAWLERFDGPAIDGIASASLTLDGTVDQPAIEAEFDLKDVRADKATATDLPPVNLAARAELRDGRLISQLQASGLTEQPITANAGHPLTLKLRPFTLDMPKNGALEGDIAAKLSLARLADLLALDGQVLKGTLSTDLKLAGTLQAPLIDGPIRLEDGEYENNASGTVLNDLTLEASASSERLTVKQLSARVGKSGSIQATGWIDLNAEDNFPLSVSLALSDAQLVARDDVEATIGGDIVMIGNLGDAAINGDLIVRRAEISIPDGGGPDLPDIDIEEIGDTIVNAGKTEEVKEQAFDPELDLAINLPNKVYVRGRGLDSEWQGKLRITGPTSDPRITGDLSVKKGYFDFIEKRFEIEEGAVDFNGTSPPNPILRIKAAAADDDFTAIIKLDGPANDPKLTLESEPILPEDEVLARLLFNRELSEIGPVEAGKLALALNKLRGGGGFDAFGEIRDALKIDTLDIVGGEEAADSKVKAGKYLSDDVYLEVERGAAGESGRARVEIEILPSISLEADTGEDSSGGVGIKWRFDY